MTYTERHAAILVDNILTAVVRPTMYPVAVLRLIYDELCERIEMLRAEHEPSDHAEIQVLIAFATYLETRMLERARKET